MTPEDLMLARQPERKSYDWSVIVLWASLLISVSMITATLMWNLGRSIKIASYLKEQGVETCVALHHPPGHKGEASSSPYHDACEAIVEKKHDACIETTETYHDDFSKRRTEYMACVIIDGMRLAAQNNKPPEE